MKKNIQTILDTDKEGGLKINAEGNKHVHVQPLQKKKHNIMIITSVENVAKLKFENDGNKYKFTFTKN
jgi:hypothetical protein